jgi:hypothetical protein
LTTGIYILKFPNTDKVYIGLSLHIENRYKQHLYSLGKREASSKLQQAFDTYGPPAVETLLECFPDELEEAEKEAIFIYNSIENGFNTLDSSNAPILYGETNGNAKYSNEKYYEVLKLLAEPGYSVKQIAKITEVSEYVIAHISALEAHQWLEELYPEEYSKVRHIKYNGGRKSAFMQGIKYPPIVDPYGIEHRVLHCTNFALEHGLSQPKLSEVLNGKRNSHKGWKLKKA